MGPGCTADAAGVASNFQRMVRIADSTGIPLDSAMQVLSEDLRAELGINDYVAAANTQGLGPLKKLFAKLVRVPRMRKIIVRQSTGGDELPG